MARKKSKKPKKLKKLSLNAPELFINRELSWLEFNDRVLRQGLDEALPPLERLKFLSIVSSNLDEFFMIRVAGLMQQRAAGLRQRDPSGLSPSQQLQAISRRVHRMLDEHARGVRDVLARLAEEGIEVRNAADWTPAQRNFARDYFEAELQPVLTPLAIEEDAPYSVLPGLDLNIGLMIRPLDKPAAHPRLMAIPVPRQSARFINLPGRGRLFLGRVEDIIATHAELLAPGYQVVSRTVFRITRDGDVAISDDDAADLLQTVEQAVRDRRRRAAVRMAVSAGTDPELVRRLRLWLHLRPEDTYETEGPLDAAALMELVNRPGFEQLKVPDWPPQTPRDLLGADDLWAALRDRDVLLVHPYESFRPVVQLLQEAADDPTVLAIKQTLYRTSGDSPLVQALARAARSGKQVTVLVELKARFDEARNVVWARRLEDAGCYVIYGIAGYKTHAKALLIIRREPHGIRRYLHLSTGNYNDRTARLYSDFGLMTTDPDLTADAAAFFNLLTGYSEVVGWSQLTIAPTDLRQRFLELIQREIETSNSSQPGLIMVKVNSLQDKEICQALYRASQAGVRVLLNVRGICCLRPGIAGLSHNITVRSVVDRYLEHARVFYFANGGHDELYMSSADWMTRNLDRRLELLFPVTSPALRARLVDILNTFFADNVQAWQLRPDGQYERLSPRNGDKVRAQQKLYQDAVQAARAAKAGAVRFQPLVRPE